MPPEIKIISKNGTLSTICNFIPLIRSDVVYTIQWLVGGKSIRRIQLPNNSSMDEISETILPRCELGSKVKCSFTEILKFKHQYVTL